MARTPDNRDATPARAPRVGLLAAARVANDNGRTVRWGAGVDWLTEMHGPDAGGYPFGARAAKCGLTALTAGEDEKAYTEQADPFSVYAFDWCSSMDSRFVGRDWQGRATRLLEATQSASIAAEFWRGAIATAETLVNTFLADGTASVVTGGATVPGKALALLDEYATERMSNGQAMIHCSVKALNRLVQADAVRREGALWVTPSDNIVVADAGYDGAGSAGTGDWMFASTVPDIWLGPIEVTPLDERAIQTSVNDIFVIAQRDVIVLHEPHVVHGAAQLDLT